MQKKIKKKHFFFLGNSIWIDYVKLTLFTKEYLSSAANVLTNSPKILHITKRDFFRLNSPNIDQ